MVAAIFVKINNNIVGTEYIQLCTIFKKFSNNWYEVNCRPDEHVKVYKYYDVYCL